MRDYIDSSKLGHADIILSQYEGIKPTDPNNRKTVKHNGHLYVKVAEVTHQETGIKGFFLRIGACFVSLATLFIVPAIFPKDIAQAFRGKEIKSLYAKLNDHTASTLDHKISTIINSRNLVPQANDLAPQAVVIVPSAPQLSPMQEYQLKLKDLIKQAFTEIYNNEDLVILLSDEDPKTLENGRENLVDNGYLRLAYFAQLAELGMPSICPDPNRKQRIEELKKQLETANLPDKVQEIFTKKLLGDDVVLASEISDENQRAIVQNLYDSITELAQELHQGKLSKITFSDEKKVYLFEGLTADIAKPPVEEIKPP